MIQHQHSATIVPSSNRDDEAFARLEFLVRQPFACGVIAGPSGCGKSDLLRACHDRVRRSTAASCLIDAAALDDVELAWELGAAFGLGLSASDSDRQIVRSLRSHLAGMRETSRHTVMLVDNADRLASSGRSLLVRLMDEAEGRSGLAVIWTARTPFSAALRDDLLPRTLLRIDREPLTLEETEAHIRDEHSISSSGQPRFDPDALRLVQEQTGGALRSINRLSRMARLAAEADGETSVSAETIRAAADELP